MKITPQLLRELAEYLEEMGSDWSETPPAGTLFSWMLDFVATEMDNRASDFRNHTFRVK